jgi:hypothetical protein
MYITIDGYKELYDPIEEKLFNRLSFDAFRVMDNYTTGVDGVKKLREFFPTDDYNAQAVKHCAAKLINLMAQIQDAESALAMGRGYTETENGLQRKIVSRVEAGNEAISYMESNVGTSVVDKAVADKAVRDKLFLDTVREGLSGITDANGVNLLYMGAYPRRFA